MNSAARPKSVSKARAPRTILTTVRKRRAARRIGWKRRALTITVHAVCLILAAVLGAGVFVGSQKLESVNLRRRCWKMKEELKAEGIATCGDRAAKAGDQCTSAWWKTKFDQLAACHGARISDPKPPCTMGRALVYAYSIYSTIGYGNVAAKTTGGQIFTIIYAVLGIPFFLGCLNHFGKWFHYWLVCAYEKLRRRTGAGKKFELTTTDAEDAGVFLFAVFVMVVYLSLAAGLYSILQDWPFWRSFYFLYQSMALIGFGDVYMKVEEPSLVMLHLIITTIGIVLLAMCFFIVRDWWSRVVEAITIALAKKLNLVSPASGGPGSDEDTLQHMSVSFNMDVEGEPKATSGKTTSPKRGAEPAQLSKKSRCQTKATKPKK